MENFIQEVFSWASSTKEDSSSCRNTEIDQSVANIIAERERDEHTNIEHFFHKMVAKEQLNNSVYEDYRCISSWFEIQIDDCIVAELIDEIYADANSIDGECL